MDKIENYFDYIFLPESFFEKVEVYNSEIKILVSNIAVTRGHPLYRKINNEALCFLINKYYLIFDDVSFSKRIIQEYVIQNGIRCSSGKKEIIDISLNDTRKETKVYTLAGETLTPPAWIEWEIKAISFAMEFFREV